MHTLWEHYMEILTDPAHMLVEVTLMVVVDGLLLGLVWPLIKRKIRHEHEVIDAEHGVDGHGDPRYNDWRNSWEHYDHLIFGLVGYRCDEYLQDAQYHAAIHAAAALMPRWVDEVVAQVQAGGSGEAHQPSV